MEETQVGTYYIRLALNSVQLIQNFLKLILR
jgi:hypothetical protein